MRFVEGELAYKDKHGRVWHIKQTRVFRWTAETLDKGHTGTPNLFSLQLADLLYDIDREGYLIEPTILDSEEGTESVQSSDESGGESGEEIPRGSREAEWDEPPINGAYLRPEER